MLAVALSLFFFMTPVQAQNAAAEAEITAALDAARAVAQHGPVEIKMGNQGKLNLPEGYVFIPSPQAARILTAMGNRAGNNLLGLIFPGESAGDDDHWFMVARYEASGYIKDDDARDWNADDLLKSLKEGTEAANADRRSRGIPEMEIVGWVEKPTYDAAARRLVWSMSSRDKGAAAGSEQGVNYNTYALGREGYITLNLVTSLRTVEKEKPLAKKMLAALEFDEGKRYTDFNISTDKVAEYGLAALVAGVAAKKLGLFAIIGAFFLKFTKVLLLGGAAVMAGAVKWWKGKKDTDAS